MIASSRNLLLLITLLASLGLSGCGQTGPLYMPDKNGEPKQQPEDNANKTGISVWTDIGSDE